MLLIFINGNVKPYNENITFPRMEGGSERTKCWYFLTIFGSMVGKIQLLTKDIDSAGDALVDDVDLSGVVYWKVV